MCREVLTTGKVIVKRPDREELLAIRNGAWTYEQLIEFAESEDVALNELYNNTNVLSKIPDKAFLDKLCIELVEEFLSDSLKKQIIYQDDPYDYKKSPQIW